MKRLKSLFIFFVASFSAFSFAAIDALEFESVQQEESYHKLTEELRCPQCQNNNIADSNALIAQDMRKKVFALLKEGKEEQEIVDYMVDRYGDFVTYNPPFKVSTILLWLAPLFVLGVALVRIFRPAPRIEKTFSVSTSLNQEEEARLKAILEKDK